MKLVSFSNNFDSQRIFLMNIEMRIRKNYQSISTRLITSIERWLDKKTSPYGGFKK